MNKQIKLALIGVAIVIIAGAATTAALVWLMPKENVDQAVPKKSTKQKAADADAQAKELLDATAKIGSGKEADKKTQEAAAKFGEASKLYEQSGDKTASYEAQANADALASRLAAEEAQKKQLEAEHAQQKAAMEAAKAAMSGGGQ